MTFRLFDAQSRDAESHSVVLREGETSAEDWPFVLAEEVNEKSSLAKIGVLDPEGSLYQCRPFPYSGWCNQNGLYYAPGTGLAWEDAWVRLD